MSSTKLTDGVQRPFFLRFGNSSFGPLRFPARLSDQFLRAAAASTIPERKACVDTSRHHGATSSRTCIQRIPRLFADHDTGGVNRSSGTPAPRSARRTARFSKTVRITQL
ncbi:MAG: hypothetical protein ACRDZ7_20030 [Acidimicrobiia bacterium]